MNPHSHPVLKKIATAVMILGLIAMAVTVYLTYAHFKPESLSFCNFASNFNCEIVNQSEYSLLLGIPVSILGFFAYLVIVYLAVLIRKALDKNLHGKKGPMFLYKVLAVVAAGGTLFSLYLTYIEAYVLQTWCIFCLTQQLIIATILILSLIARNIMLKSQKAKGVCEFC